MKSTEMPARLATLDELMQTTVPAFFKPVPTRDTVRDWLDNARPKVPRFKANPSAKRGGGPVFYSVAAFEKWLKTRVN